MKDSQQESHTESRIGFSRKVYADTEVQIPSIDLYRSLRGIKVELHAARWTLTRHKQCGKRRDKMKYYAIGADMALLVLRLERIVSDMMIVFTQARLNELKAIKK